MIGKLTGYIDFLASDHVILDVQGVGYVIYCSERTLAALPKQGQVVALYTDLLVREDNLQLFGFLTLADKEWHKMLIAVQGVGGKAALAIMSALGTDGIFRAIVLGDANAIKVAPGIGPKIAQRIVSELKDKVSTSMAFGTEQNISVTMDHYDANDHGGKAVNTPDNNMAPMADANIQADALSALINLGYTQADALTAVTQVCSKNPQAKSSDVIKLCLQLLVPKG